MTLKYPEEFCYNLTHGLQTNKNLSDSVQNEAANLEVVDGILLALPAVIFSLFVGAWSDSNGRKAVLVIPFIGNILSFLIYIANYYFFEIDPLHLLWGSVAGVTGGYVCLNIGLYGYVSDVSTAENRTTRLSILNGVFSAGYVIGTSLGGKLYKIYGNYYLNFGISIGFGVAGMIYAIFITKETIIHEDIGREKRRFFDFKNVTESLSVAFKSRPNNGRLHVILLIINFSIFMFCLNTFHYDYLLVINRYNWDAHDYSTYISIQRICRFVGLFALLPLLSKIFKLPDAIIATFGTLLTTIAYLLMALGPSSWSISWDPSWLMYISAALQFNSIITVTIRSQCTKEVEKSEIGRIFAVVALGMDFSITGQGIPMVFIREVGIARPKL